ncbi:hypothetical protein LFT44_02325 [Arthrobacter sp. FW306-05-C]|uniref:hypothetical protein n=1 Tax=Arthrobacter TaxID=1663 RepID=UPI001EEFB357|nr:MULTISPECIES: hypothetical protein [Arthrobacter]MDP9986047.1 hypothetical protein [Arthrobacter oryzae]UKA67292.1 hypothetical protein LFT44_02325 [Arthrobacter sp. FW306-05-C]UKA75926.1 hypothetical protein LFT46_02310 [Arthrobacter sp. FW306-07-I]
MSSSVEDRGAAEETRGSTGTLMRRVLYRETHSSRASVSIAAAALVLILAAYGVLESGVHAVGQPAWLIEPQVAAQRIVDLPAGISPLLLSAIGAVLAMLGLIFFLNGVLPGKRARHLLAGAPGEGLPAVVVDDEVIASSLARRARLAANVTPEQVMVVVSQRQVLVNVRPTSGIPVDQDRVLDAIRDELDQMLLEPAPVPRVNVTASGVVGA